jgi:hypothetical protein
MHLRKSNMATCNRSGAAKVLSAFGSAIWSSTGCTHAVQVRHHFDLGCQANPLLPTIPAYGPCLDSLRCASDVDEQQSGDGTPMRPGSRADDMSLSIPGYIAGAGFDEMENL